jgi:UDP-2,3-diacylglucosamine pyrophosphatase LpxH
MSCSPYRLSGRCALISDLHLNGGARDAYVLRALRELSEVFGPLEHLIIVGDLFDFHLGYSSQPYPHLTPVYKALESLIKRGVSVWSFTGNHDPDPCPWLKALGVRVLTQATTFELDVEEGATRRLLIEHGDLRESSVLKRALCRLVRASWVCSLARLLPPRLTLALAPRLPDHLNKPAESRAPQLTLEPSLWNTLKRAWTHISAQPLPPDLWVMGHFHELSLTALPQEPARCEAHQSSYVLTLGEWVRLNTFALIDSEGVRLYQHHPLHEGESAQRFELLMELVMR